MSAKTILVVDDSKSARFAMRRFLENFGYAVDTAASAEDALGYLQNRVPEAVFLDHLMPGTDGLMMLRSIKQNAQTAQVPIVLCSSNDAADFLQQARACGALDVLPKPPATEQLRAVLERVRLQCGDAPGAEPAAAEPAPGAGIEADSAEAAGAGPAIAGPAVFAAAPIDATAGDYAAPPPRPVLAELPEPRAAAAADPLERFSTHLRGLAGEWAAQLAAMQSRLDQQESAVAGATLEAQAGSAAERAVALLAQDVERRLEALRGELEQALLLQQRRLDEMLAEQARRLDTAAAGLRQSLSEEVNAAGARIAEQLADALVRGLRMPAAAAPG